MDSVDVRNVEVVEALESTVDVETSNVDMNGTADSVVPACARKSTSTVEPESRFAVVGSSVQGTRLIQNSGNNLIDSLRHVKKPSVHDKLQSKPVVRKTGTVTPAASGDHPTKRKESSDASHVKRATMWSWPLPVQPRVQNDPKSFVAEFDVYPYRTTDVWARIMGQELMVKLDPDEADDLQESDNSNRGSRGRLRLITRTFQLPENLDARSVQFGFKKEHIFIMSAQKINKELPVACYIDNLKPVAVLDDVMKRKLLLEEANAKVEEDPTIDTKDRSIFIQGE